MIRVTARVGYVVVVFLALVGISSVVGRFVYTLQYLVGASWLEVTAAPPVAPGEFDARYYEHPYLTLVHVVAGFVFMVLGPVQFWPAVRNRWIGYHRFAGRMWMIASLVGTSAALMMVPMLPVFGSFSSGVAVTIAGLAFLVCLAQGYRQIRRRRIETHREWMIRAFALGLGISTFRLQLVLLTSLGVPFVEAWDTVSWLGFLTNAVVAEVWINVTRRQPAVLPSSTPIRRRGVLQTI